MSWSATRDARGVMLVERRREQDVYTLVHGSALVELTQTLISMLNAEERLRLAAVMDEAFLWTAFELRGERLVDLKGTPPCGGSRCFRADNGTWVHSSKSYGSCSVRNGDVDPK